MKRKSQRLSAIELLAIVFGVFAVFVIVAAGLGARDLATFALGLPAGPFIGNAPSSIELLCVGLLATGVLAQLPEVGITRQRRASLLALGVGVWFLGSIWGPAMAA